MKRRGVSAVLLGCVILAPIVVLVAQSRATEQPESGLWPTKGWVKATAASVGLDEKVLDAFDKELASGKYGLVDSFTVFRCAKEVYAKKYAHDYGKIYGKQAKETGPLNARLTEPNNYFDPAWHPYYKGTDLHSMQSVSKTVTSVILGISMTIGDFKAGFDTPGLKYFEAAKVKNIDDRKSRMTLKNVFTMTTGLEWNEGAVSDCETPNDLI